MTALYLLLNLGSISIPFAYSFHPKLKFFKLWKPLFLGIAVMMCVFIPWDIIFTQNKFWAFNTDYYLGIEFLNLPIEEWLFFICIPYACVFTHYALLHYFPTLKIKSKPATKIASIVLILIFSFLAISNSDKWYTLVNFSYASLLLLIAMNELELLQKYYLTFLVMLIPFFIVNGILTGSFITDQVVWYNNDENLGIRMFTIPIEDSIYAFSMILTVLLVMKKWESLFLKKGF